MNEATVQKFNSSLCKHATKNKRKIYKKNLYVRNDNEKYFARSQMRHSSTCDSFRHFKYNYLMFSIFPCFAPLFITSVHPHAHVSFKWYRSFERQIDIRVRCLFVILSESPTFHDTMRNRTTRNTLKLVNHDLVFSLRRRNWKLFLRNKLRS